MTPYSWLCPYCNRIATITHNNVSASHHEFDCANKEKRPLTLVSSVIVCPNNTCHEYCITASLYQTRPTAGGGRTIDKEAFLSWNLRPNSSAKPLPTYIPIPIRADYEEACLIAGLSPKASATLARRCLQGIIRDFWGISKSRLIDEIAELHGRIDNTTWAAIDAVRKIGNIGAHMEKDINSIIDVDSEEAVLLIELIEVLIGEWYVRRHERDEQMNKIIAAAASKITQKP